MNAVAENEEGGTDGPEPVLTPEVLPGLFRSHADAVNRTVDTFAEEIETDGKPTARQLGTVRTELRELDAAIEEIGADLCEDAEAWEHIHDYAPFT